MPSSGDRVWGTFAEGYADPCVGRRGKRQQRKPAGAKLHSVEIGVDGVDFPSCGLDPDY